jgi:hypothetical protein
MVGDTPIGNAARSRFRLAQMIIDEWSEALGSTPFGRLKKLRKLKSTLRSTRGVDILDPFLQIEKEMLPRMDQVRVNIYSQRLALAFLRSMPSRVFFPTKDRINRLKAMAQKRLAWQMHLQLFQFAAAVSTSGRVPKADLTDKTSPRQPVERGARPGKLQNGVTDTGAERLVRDWLIHLGVADARVTQQSRDGGLDVVSKKYIAEVKNYAGTVGVKVVRELLGVSVSERKTPLLFTSGNYTQDARDFAYKNDVALFQYDARGARLDPANGAARTFLSEMSIEGEKQAAVERKISIIRANRFLLESAVNEIHRVRRLLYAVDLIHQLLKMTPTVSELSNIRSLSAQAKLDYAVDQIMHHQSNLIKLLTKLDTHFKFDDQFPTRVPQSAKRFADLLINRLEDERGVNDVLKKLQNFESILLPAVAARIDFNKLLNRLVSEPPSGQLPVGFGFHELPEESMILRDLLRT